MAAGAKTSKVKWDSEADRRKIIDIARYGRIFWKSTMGKYRADYDWDSERIRGSHSDSFARGIRREATKLRESGFTKVRCQPFSLCILLKV